MPLRSSSQHYGTVAIAIHWLTALAVIALLGSGQVMANNGEDLLARILPVHVVLGVTVGALTLLRIVWWLGFDRQPGPVAGLSKTQRSLASAVHLALYVALLVMAASGAAMLILTGAAPAIFGGAPLPDFRSVPPFMAHSLVSRLLLVLALGHVAAALWHHFIRRDGLIHRMLPAKG